MTQVGLNRRKDRWYLVNEVTEGYEPDDHVFRASRLSG